MGGVFSDSGVGGGTSFLSGGAPHGRGIDFGRGGGDVRKNHEMGEGAPSVKCTFTCQKSHFKPDNIDILFSEKNLQTFVI